MIALDDGERTALILADEQNGGGGAAFLLDFVAYGLELAAKSLIEGAVRLAYPLHDVIHVEAGARYRRAAIAPPTTACRGAVPAINRRGAGTGERGAGRSPPHCSDRAGQPEVGLLPGPHQIH